MMRHSVPSDRRGVALPTALFALVVIGALVGGVFFTARLEQRGGVNAMAAARATEAAQAGLMVGIPNTLNWAIGLTADGQKYGTAVTRLGTTGSYYVDSVTRLNRYMYLLRSYGMYVTPTGDTIARRTMAQLVKRYMPEMEVNSGAIVVGNANVQGSVDIDGTDHTPTGWTDCAAPGADQPGLRTNGTVSGNAADDIEPSYTEGDTTVTNMSRVLDTLFFQLASQANFISTAANVGTAAPSYVDITNACKTTDALNWGDGLRTTSPTTCQTYYPVIYLNPGGPGNVVVVHVSNGQGILLVNGDLKFNGTNYYVGLVLVRGQYQSGGGTMHLVGSLISQNVDLDPSKFSGNLTIDYSRCGVNNALNNLAVSAPTQYRGFMQF
jgi:hypothetical protein